MARETVSAPDIPSFALQSAACVKDTNPLCRLKAEHRRPDRLRHIASRSPRRYPVASLAVLCTLFFLTGCLKVGPDYVKPKLSTPVTWQVSNGSGVNEKQPNPNSLARWWTGLHDPLLSRFVDQAITGNLDLKQAQARLLEAHARRDISRAGLFPTLDLSASATRSRSGGSESNSYSAGFDAGWELDLFGGTRRSLEAAQARVEASRADLHDVLVSLVAEVALNYIDIRTYQKRLQIARKNLGSQNEALSLTEARFQSGLATDLDVQQAKYLVASTRAQIPDLRSGMVEAANQLAVLLGSSPGSITTEMQDPRALPALPATIAVGIPADTLRRRPDVRRAERLLAAQTAEIGVAKAALYPSFRLGGTLGFSALSAEKLFDSDSETYSIGPGITIPLFHAGAIRANIRLQSSLQQEVLAQYKATVLNALQEVNNSLMAYAQQEQKNKALAESVAAARKASSLAEMQYTAGLISFSSVLDARRSLFSFQDQLAQGRGTMVADLIRLYKAVGGGWDYPATGAKHFKKVNSKPEESLAKLQATGAVTPQKSKKAK